MTTTPAHHHQLIPAPQPEASQLAPEDAVVAPTDTAAPDALRQKSAFLAGSARAEDEEEEARDVIPSLPRVSYSEGGEMA